MISGGKVRDQQILSTFCQPGVTLIGWIVAGTPLRALRVKREKQVMVVLLNFLKPFSVPFTKTVTQ